MAMIMTCRNCRTKFEPDKPAIYSGNWSICPDCREQRRWGSSQHNTETNAAKDAANEERKTT